MYKVFALFVAAVLCLFSLQTRATETRRDGKGTPATQPAAAHEVTQITLERTPCYGHCPVYTLVIRSDGSFTYRGQSNVDRMGDHTGKLAEGQFLKLAKQAIAIGYMELQDNYVQPVRDLPSVLTSVTMDGHRKSIRDHARSGPEKLQAFEQAITAALSGAH